MKRNIVFLSNPISGGAKKDNALKQIEETCKQQAIQFEILPTVASGNYDFLRTKIHDEKVTDIVIIGGDGSVNQVVQSLHQEKVKFGIIPFGSGNGFALAAGIPKNITRAINIILEGNASVVDAFMVNDQFSCMLSGVGFDAKVAHDFATKSSRGLITYTQQSIINFFKAHPYQFEVAVDGFSFFTEAFFISVANANQFGNNVTIAPKASLNDGMLDVVIVQKMNKAKLPFAILKQLRGNNKMQQLVEDMSKKNILYFQTNKITINNIKHAPLHIDGEPKETAEKITFEVIRDCFELLQPSTN
ncbi:YegS/Rv2252/BmrU family lipid kinase [Panacibacter sp. DH6]|uniref:YegS/Rv2252/BmrU family lipid kinase n=1 Tax=Panacibacter microcysteis TaxID=2793269 RepID=A0A931E356_9BACT|nr:YegS/Rv2252/BmrU family lipid kinase [Panacibacter microcysteis]MBG9375272.1 YegS/Rv2252/BmrU family lipid kinase [Panacibacter microcysteis]